MNVIVHGGRTKRFGLVLAMFVGVGLLTSAPSGPALASVRVVDDDVVTIEDEPDDDVVTIEDEPDEAVPAAIDPDDAAITDEDTTILINVLANDTEPDAGTTLTITEIDDEPFMRGDPIALLSDAIVIVNVGGTISYDPNGEFDDLTPGEQRIDSFTYTAEDEAGATIEPTVVITVVGVNHAPTAVDDEVFVELNGSATFNVADNDSDSDGDEFTVALLAPPEHGTVRCVTDGECTYTPDEGYSGLDAFTYSIVDVVALREFALDASATVVVVVGVDTSTSTTTTVARPELPATGDHVGSMMTVAVVAAFLGSVLVAVSRRRSTL